MNGHAISQHSVAFEESLMLLDEKSLSDMESDSGRADYLASRSPAAQQWAKILPAKAAALLGRPPPISSWLALLRRAGFLLIPSFIQFRISHDHGSRGPERLGPTAYLDGMRGVASFAVFLCHYLYTCFIIAEGWGARGDNYNVLKLPFVRLIYAGPPMVAVFFVISGYALSLKPIKLARQQKWDEFATTVSSFVFRRFVRLFVPTAISTLIIVVLLRLGAYEWTRDFSKDNTYMKNIQEIGPDLKDTLREQLDDWCRNMFDFVHVWDWDKYGGSTYYDVHLWTIPVEFRASMLLFLTLVGLARLRTGTRFALLVLVAFFSYLSDRWEMVLFFSGMLFAELDVIRGAHGDPVSNSAAVMEMLPLPESRTALDIVGTGPSPSRQPCAKGSVLGRVTWAATSVVALFLMSQPDIYGETTPGWVFLSSLVPDWFSEKYRYWQCVGSSLFVLCVSHMPCWQRVFTTPVAQYLGRISYAIYLMHGPVLHTLGYAIERWAWAITGVDGYNYNLGFMLSAVFVVPFVIWAADVFWRTVDAPVVRFAKSMELICLVR